MCVCVYVCIYVQCIYTYMMPVRTWKVFYGSVKNTGNLAMSIIY